MMAMPIMVPVSVSALKPQAAPSSSKKNVKSRPALRERTIVYEGSSSPRELMESVVIQAQAAIKGLGSDDSSKTQELTEEEKRQNVLDVKGKQKDTAISGENAKLRSFW
jgi:hypothetical protein